MRRYWIDAKDRQGDIVQFRGDVHHHIFDVCRQDVGSKFEVLSEDGKAALVEVLRVDKKSAEARVIEERVIPPLKTPLIRLVLSIPRFPVMEAVVEKAVEMGVSSIHPVFSDFSFVRTEGNLSDAKVERWRKIIRSATQQSGRGELMKLEPAIKLEDFLRTANRGPSFAGLFAYEGDSVLGVREALAQIKSKHEERLQEVWLFVGSEGGFSDREVSLFKSLGLQPVTLGAQVLRVETACMALVSVLKYEFDLMC